MGFAPEQAHDNSSAAVSCHGCTESSSAADESQTAASLRKQQANTLAQ
jgi:hypothetical protein